ncbi:phosphonate ABC transporter ATP-binding protein [Phenylobacterium sp.]|uniref:phosphonate ABC transporter ATP-binding protein n=1 Tax=Phenylobacterium sp. TaxID=1871053 RepID=UPI002E375F01|nr:phosphonate ABC transporter ATP-binding protein [Phenylobacterium sp.]HEX2560255.1 phosphonate ABC transporter ATP-binding protein [Phenylobacterium sp.]
MFAALAGAADHETQVGAALGGKLQGVFAVGVPGDDGRQGHLAASGAQGDRGGRPAAAEPALQRIAQRGGRQPRAGLQRPGQPHRPVERNGADHQESHGKAHAPLRPRRHDTSAGRNLMAQPTNPLPGAADPPPGVTGRSRAADRFAETYPEGMRMLELQGLRKQFGETAAVAGVSLRIERGEVVGIIGRSGAGKSTLLRMINRLTDPTEGSILWDGQDVTRFGGRELRRWRRRCAMIFQQFNLCPRLDVITNVLVGVVAERPLGPSLLKMFPASDRARAVLELDALDMAAAALQRASTLSGGQQQRVAIARAMMQEPDMLLADEPVASLDPVNAEVVMEALQRAAQERNIPVIVNLHSLDIARRYCTRVVAMAKGVVVFDGPPSELTGDLVDRIYGGRAPRPAPLEPFKVVAAA